MQEEIFEKVAQLITANNDLPAESITMDSTFEELNMDSLDGLALITDLEKHFGISIPGKEAVHIRSVRQTVEKLERLLLPQA